MHNYSPADMFTALVPLLDDSDLVLPAAATIDTPLETLADRTQWLKNRTGGARVVGLYGNAIGALGYANVWSDTAPVTGVDPSFSQLNSTSNLVVFGAPPPLVSADSLLVRCDVTATIASPSGATVVGFGIGLSLAGGAFSVMAMSERYIVPLQSDSVGLIPNTVPISMSAILTGSIASSFNFCIMASKLSGTPRVQLRGIGVISVIHLSGN